MVTFAFARLPLSDTLTVTGWLAVTVAAVAVNVPVLAPAAMLMEPGVVSAVLLSEIATVDPPVGAP